MVLACFQRFCCQKVFRQISSLKRREGNQKGLIAALPGVIPGTPTGMMPMPMTEAFGVIFGTR